MTSKRKQEIKKQRESVPKTKKNSDDKVDRLIARLTCALVFVILLVLAIRGGL